MHRERQDEVYQPEGTFHVQWLAADGTWNVPATLVHSILLLA